MRVILACFRHWEPLGLQGTKRRPASEWPNVRCDSAWATKPRKRSPSPRHKRQNRLGPSTSSLFRPLVLAKTGHPIARHSQHSARVRSRRRGQASPAFTHSSATKRPTPRAATGKKEPPSPKQIRKGGLVSHHVGPANCTGPLIGTTLRPCDASPNRRGRSPSCRAPLPPVPE